MCRLLLSFTTLICLSTTPEVNSVSVKAGAAVAVMAARGDTEPEMMMLAELDCAKPAVAEANSAIAKVICFFIWFRFLLRFSPSRRSVVGERQGNRVGVGVRCGETRADGDRQIFVDAGLRSFPGRRGDRGLAANTQHDRHAVVFDRVVNHVRIAGADPIQARLARTGGGGVRGFERDPVANVAVAQ